MLTLSASLLAVSRTVESFVFFISSPDLGWGLFYVFTAFLFASFFFFALFSAGTAAIFGGNGGYIQSVWNCGIYALVLISAFTGLQFMTGVTEDDAIIMTASEAAVFLLILYNAILYLALKKGNDFYWKNILPKDTNTKLCIKVYGLMILVLEVGSFLYANKMME